MQTIPTSIEIPAAQTIYFFLFTYFYFHLGGLAVGTIC